jgi:hypothetical protein
MENKKILWIVGIVSLVLLAVIVVVFLNNNSNKENMANNLSVSNNQTVQNAIINNKSVSNKSAVSNIVQDVDWCKKGESWTNSKISNVELKKQIISVVNNETICVVFANITGDRYAFNKDESKLYKYIFVNYSAKEQPHFELIS